MKILYISLLLLCAPWMLAQTLGGTVIRGSVTFGDWVVWSDATVPEGSYTLTLEYAHAPVKVTLRSAHGKTQVFIPVAILAGVKSGHERLCLSFRKSRWQVRSIDLPKLGISLLFIPRNQLSTVEHSKCVPIVTEIQGAH